MKIDDKTLHGNLFFEKDTKQILECHHSPRYSIKRTQSDIQTLIPQIDPFQYLEYRVI